MLVHVPGITQLKTKALPRVVACINLVIDNKIMFAHTSTAVEHL